MHLGTACYCDTAQPVLTDTGAHRASLDDWTGEAVSRPPQEQSRLMGGGGAGGDQGDAGSQWV